MPEHRIPLWGLVDVEGHLRKRVVDYAIVDACDYGRFRHLRWYRSGRGYAVRHNHGDGPRNIFLHREILKAPPGRQVDHINGVRLDDRRTNLRLATNAENAQNRTLSPKNSSGYRGVSWCRGRRKWEAYVRIDGKQRHLGYYGTAEEAAQAAERHRERHMPFSSEARRAA